MLGVVGQPDGGLKEEGNMELEKLTKGWDFTGRTIVIPGGAGVLGGEMGCALVRCGANVVILDRDLSRVDSLKERLEQGPGSGNWSMQMCL